MQGKLFSLSISYIVIENELKSMLHFIREYKFPCLVAFVTWAVLCFIGFFPFQIWNADLGCHCRRLLRTCPLPDFEESCCVFLLGNHEFLVTECWCSYLLAFIGFWTTCNIASSRVSRLEGPKTDSQPIRPATLMISLRENVFSISWFAIGLRWSSCMLVRLIFADSNSAERMMIIGVKGIDST